MEENKIAPVLLGIQSALQELDTLATLVNDFIRRRKHNDKMKRYFAAHPEQAQKKCDRVKARYHSDPEYAERVRARARLYAAQRKAAQIEVAEGTVV